MRNFGLLNGKIAFINEFDIQFARFHCGCSMEGRKTKRHLIFYQISKNFILISELWKKFFGHANAYQKYRCHHLKINDSPLPRLDSRLHTTTNTNTSKQKSIKTRTNSRSIFPDVRNNLLFNK